jgi:hypothetical protein
VNRKFEAENARERARLCNLVQGMTDEELGLVLYEEGWTISAALGHLAFWDKRRLELIRKWKQAGVSPFPLIDDIVNDVLVPFLSAIPPRANVNLAISIAEELDRELELASADFISSIESLGDEFALNRASHRKLHLDDIDALLGETRKAQ